MSENERLALEVLKEKYQEEYETILACVEVVRKKLDKSKYIPQKLPAKSEDELSPVIRPADSLSGVFALPKKLPEKKEPNPDEIRRELFMYNTSLQGLLLGLGLDEEEINDELNDHLIKYIDNIDEENEL